MKKNAIAGVTIGQQKLAHGLTVIVLIRYRRDMCSASINIGDKVTLTGQAEPGDPQ